MTISLTIEAKVVGQRRSGATWRLEVGGAAHQLLRDVITQVVRAEVNAFRERQEARRLIHILSPDEIAQGLVDGKVESGGRDLKQDVDPAAAVERALQAFEDGLYLVFLDGEQKKALNAEVVVRPDSRLSFLRLTPLAGG